MPRHHLQQLVLERIEQEPAYPKLDIIDLSCGEGEVVRTLRSRGCNAVGTRYTENDYIIRKDRLNDNSDAVISQVDLTAELPFDTASADVIILTEVIEHLRDTTTLVHEIGRVLRPGGLLLLSTPNIHRLHSRLRYLLTGAHKLIRKRPGWDVEKDELYKFHISPVYFPYLHTLLHQSGLRVEQLPFSRVKLRHLGTVLLYPLVLLASLLEYSGFRRPKAAKRGERALLRLMIHPAMLFSEQLVIVARREQLRPIQAKSQNAENGTILLDQRRAASHRKQPR